jgi:hypothetical protein
MERKRKDDISTINKQIKEYEKRLTESWNKKLEKPKEGAYRFGMQTIKIRKNAGMSLNYFNQKMIITPNTGCIVLSELEAHDIDNEIDWKIAELKYEILQNQKIN